MVWTALRIGCVIGCSLWGITATAQTETVPSAAEVQLVARPVEISVTPNGASASAFRIDKTDPAVEKRLLTDVTYLSSDELEGRGLQTHGLDLAADYLAEQFRTAGLKVDLYQGTPFQEFKLYSSGTTGTVQSVVMQLPGQPAQSLVAGHDYTSLMVTPSKPFRFPVVFAGYGITDKRRQYDDYARVDARGKAVIVLRHEPQKNEPNSPFDGTNPTDHAYLLEKVRNAYDHGAVALILCTDAATFAEENQRETLLDVELTSGIGAESLPVIHCRRSIVEAWLQNSLQRPLADLEAQIDATLKPQSALLPNAEFSGTVAVVRPGKVVKNVVGVLEGQGDLASETIVIGAHYDHLGRGGWGSLSLGANDEIHNGADDNASGTAVLIETARQLSSQTTARRRRVVFIGFAAEELGLYGSKRYVQDPLVPLSDTVAMLNLDMVGRLRDRHLTMFGTGTAVEWPEWLAQLAEPRELRLQMEPSGFGPSDHAPFYEHGIPVLHFFTGFHPEYHRPTDDPDRLNIAGMRQITGLLVDLVQQLDQSATRPKPLAVGQPFHLENANSINGVMAGTAIQPRPRMGVALAVSGDGKGIAITHVQPGSLAARAGLLPGDILLQVNETAATTVTSVQETIAGLQRGQTIKLQLDRGGIHREMELLFTP
ncbi:M28 family peptidase [bacterium]|nr:M28 family peptidase [bacterium]